jgi:hypothetical protein
MRPVPSRRRRLLGLACATVAALAGGLSACGGGGGGASAPAPAPPPAASPPLPDNRVSGASPVPASCTAGQDGTGTAFVGAEVEPFLARHPAQGQHLLAAWQQDRWSNGAARAVVSAVSFDGGRSWTRTLHPFSRCGGALPGSAGDLERATDPWVDIGRDGVAHAMALAVSGAALTASGRSAMLASRSLDGGRTWSAPQTLIDDAGTAFFNDKNTLTVDPFDPRRIYAVWDRIEASGNGPTLLARSLDGGASWEPAREIHRPVAPGGVAQTIGNRIVVLRGGPEAGVLVNAFTRIDTVGGTVASSVQVQRSTDGGSTWDTPIRVAEHRGIGARDPATGTAIRDGAILPAVAAAPDGTLWLAWQDSRFSGGVRDGIALVRSTDGGRTWSAPVQANAEPRVAAFTPTLTVRDDGTLVLMYFDLRPDTADAATLLVGLWLSSTRDGQRLAEGNAWPAFDLATAPNARGLFVGDYHGLVAAGTEVLPLVAMSTPEPANRTDVFLLRTTPAAAPLRRVDARPAGAGSAPARASRAEADFRARHTAATRAWMEHRIPGWGGRVGLGPAAGDASRR